MGSGPFLLPRASFRDDPPPPWPTSHGPGPCLLSLHRLGELSATLEGLTCSRKSARELTALAFVTRDFPSFPCDVVTIPRAASLRVCSGHTQCHHCGGRTGSPFPYSAASESLHTWGDRDRRDSSLKHSGPTASYLHRPLRVTLLGQSPCSRACPSSPSLQ